MINQLTTRIGCCTSALVLTVAIGGHALAADEIELIYTADGHSAETHKFDSGDPIYISRPWTDVSTYYAQIRAANPNWRKAVDVGVIRVDDPSGISCNLRLLYNAGSNGLSSYAFRDCGGIILESDADSHLYVVGRIWGDLTGDIKVSDPEREDIRTLDFWCVGAIKEDVTINCIEVNQVRAHTIEGGVTIEAADETGAKINVVATGYSDNERLGITPPPGGWPTMADMDIGTSGNPVTLITPEDVDIEGIVKSLDDLYVELDVGGDTNVIRNAPSSSELYNYSTGSLTHRMQLTGQTVTLGDIYASADNGGYLDSASGYLNITSSTSDYAGSIESILGGSGDNEVDFRGRLWFNAGIAAAAEIRLEDAMDGEMIFNAVNNDRFWSTNSSVVIDGTNVSPDNPDYSLVTSGGGTIGMVDGVGNNLGFHLHLEDCTPSSGSTISLTGWQSGSTWIELVFYGPVYLEGSDFYVALERWDENSEEWVDGPVCIDEPTDVLVYDLLSSGTNTSLNVVKLTLCSACGCTLPTGQYRIIKEAGGLKSDLGLAQDPDVQSFTYSFTLSQ